LVKIGVTGLPPVLGSELSSNISAEVQSDFYAKKAKYDFATAGFSQKKHFLNLNLNFSFKWN